jgi:hypothetical protein
MERVDAMDKTARKVHGKRAALIPLIIVLIVV